MMAPLRSAPFRNTSRARAPEGVRIYAIGDIHGRVDLLDSLLKRIEVHMGANPAREHLEVFLGDYIDRGPASREVIERLVAHNQTNTTIFLRGNHETFITDFIKSPPILKTWQQIGGLETLLSYGIMPSINANEAAQARLAVELDRALPESHRRFIGHLRSSFTCGDFFFVHAGVRPRIPLERQSDDDLLWIREDFLFCEDDFGKVVVHGHTPVLHPEVRPNRINIDTGAYATGRLTCIVLEDDMVEFI